MFFRLQKCNKNVKKWQRRKAVSQFEIFKKLHIDNKKMLNYNKNRHVLEK